MNEFILEMLIVGILSTAANIFNIRYLIRQRRYAHETFHNLSTGSCLIVIGSVVIVIFTVIFEIIWFIYYLGSR